MINQPFQGPFSGQTRSYPPHLRLVGCRVFEKSAEKSRWSIKDLGKICYHQTQVGNRSNVNSFGILDHVVGPWHHLAMEKNHLTMAPKREPLTLGAGDVI